MSEGNGSNAAEDGSNDGKFRFRWKATGQPGKKATYEISIESLTFGERGELEDHMGQPWPLIMVSGWASSYKLLAYLAFLAVRRQNPAVELEQFSSLTDDDIDLEEDEEARPTKASGSSPENSGTQSSEPASKSAPGKSKS